MTRNERPTNPGPVDGFRMGILPGRSEVEEIITRETFHFETLKHVTLLQDVNGPLTIYTMARNSGAILRMVHHVTPWLRRGERNNSPRERAWCPILLV